MLEALSRRLGPAVIGLDPRQPDRLHRALDLALGGYRSTKSAIDVAAYDVAGKAAGLPVGALLGGMHRKEVPVCDVIGLDAPEAVRARARTLLDAGFKQVKLKAGSDFDRDLETVRAVRDACGTALQIRLDINTGYGSAAIALPLCKRLEAAGVDIFEQPVAAGDLAGMAAVAASLDAPVLAHESVATVEDALGIIQLGAADILNVSPPRAGGLYPCLQIVRIAELHHLAVMIAGAMETGPGNLASGHLGAACREQPFPGDARTVLRESETLVLEPVRIEAGSLAIPARPGLGCDLDEAAVERLRQAPWITVG
jgi:L-alanine-DL-glutamate epimerase-like enolase superfamily enzyme